MTRRLIFYVQTLAYHSWERICAGDENKKPPAGWTVLGRRYPRDELQVVCGITPQGNLPWHDVDTVSVNLILRPSV